MSSAPEPMMLSEFVAWMLELGIENEKLSRFAEWDAQHMLHPDTKAGWCALYAYGFMDRGER